MKITIAPNIFIGSLTAAEAATWSSPEGGKLQMHNLHLLNIHASRLDYTIMQVLKEALTMASSALNIYHLWRV